MPDVRQAETARYLFAQSATPHREWDGAHYWGQSEDTSITLERLTSECEVVVAGIDGGGLEEILSLVFLGRHRATKNLMAWSHSWCGTHLLKKRPELVEIIHSFQRQGCLTITGEDYSDVRSIVGLVNRVKSLGILRYVAVDPYAIGLLVEDLGKAGVTQDGETTKLVGVGQGVKMMPAIVSSARMLAVGGVSHSLDACMAWSVGNLIIESTASAIMANRSSDKTRLIDPVMAFFAAFHAISSIPAVQ